MLVLPEGCEHNYGSNEGNERRGVAYSVNLSERGEVTCLQTQKQKGRERKRECEYIVMLSNVQYEWDI